MNLTLSSCCFEYFDSGRDTVSVPAAQADKTDLSDTILCRACRNVITAQRQAIEQSGSHIHVCSNPAGYSFRFACYQTAVGCVARGLPNSEYSWFSGYSWQIVHCGVCGVHLGWLFSSTDCFYGLIINRLLEPDRAGG